MSDNELRKLCYEAMGFRLHAISSNVLYHPEHGYSIQLGQWNPLDDGRQALDMVERLELSVHKMGSYWCVNDKPNDTEFTGKSADIRRAIVLCVAKLQFAAGDADK